MRVHVDVFTRPKCLSIFLRVSSMAILRTYVRTYVRTLVANRSAPSRLENRRRIDVSSHRNSLDKAIPISFPNDKISVQSKHRQVNFELKYNFSFL